MNRFLNRANSRIGLGSAAALLIVASLLGQLLGFLRVRLINANFPLTGPESTDAYFAAFKIPDLFFFTLAAGALGVAFMPYLADRLAKNDKRSIWDISNSLLNLLAIVMAVVGVFIFVFARPLLEYIVAPGLTTEQLDNATLIMQLVAFNPLLFTLSGIFTSVQQTFGRFFFYAAAPLFYNISIIASIYFFQDSIGIVGLGLGALLGAILQLLISIFGFIGLRYKYKATIKWSNPNFREILRQLPPRSLDQGIDAVNSVVETKFASQLGQGKISFYENAYVLHTAPILLIGTTISTAAFPRMNNRLSQGRPDLFRKEFLKVLKMMIWITIPIVIFAFFSRGYLARLIFARGSAEIATVFGFFAVAILFRIIYTIISRWFYSHKDTKTPLYVSVFAIALNIYLAFVLSKHYGVSGLAMAQSAVASLEVLVLSGIMVMRDRKLLDSEFWNGISKIISASGFTIFAAYTMVQIYPLEAAATGLSTLGPKLAAIALVTFAVHIIISSLLNLDEARPIIKRLKVLVLGRVKMQ